jgi:hypothetical protein
LFSTPEQQPKVDKQFSQERRLKNPCKSVGQTRIRVFFLTFEKQLVSESSVNGEPLVIIIANKKGGQARR